MAPWYAEGTIQDPDLRADASIFDMKSVAKTTMLSEEQVKEKSKAKQNKTK